MVLTPIIGMINSATKLNSYIFSRILDFLGASFTLILYIGYSKYKDSEPETPAIYIVKNSHTKNYVEKIHLFDIKYSSCLLFSLCFLLVLFILFLASESEQINYFYSFPRSGCFPPLVSFYTFLLPFFLDSLCKGNKNLYWLIAANFVYIIMVIFIYFKIHRHFPEFFCALLFPVDFIRCWFIFIMGSIAFLFGKKEPFV